ncbi:hypothetical protein E2C01_059345 [Portunus trituberculatus]|uniref:Uncharacterized protein n=2 Tax=Portunus trituberculatus TaxID=210409 RepID=A0A5B7H536_PORTR|nr:hypothetical protein [Portunus trituberculatus]
MADSETYQGDQGMVQRPASPAPADLWSTLKKALFIIGSSTIVFVALRNSLT